MGKYDERFHKCMRVFVCVSDESDWMSLCREVCICVDGEGNYAEPHNLIRKGGYLEFLAVVGTNVYRVVGFAGS